MSEREVIDVPPAVKFQVDAREVGGTVRQRTVQGDDVEITGVERRQDAERRIVLAPRDRHVPVFVNGEVAVGEGVIIARRVIGRVSAAVVARKNEEINAGVIRDDGEDILLRVRGRAGRVKQVARDENDGNTVFRGVGHHSLKGQ